MEAATFNDIHVKSSYGSVTTSDSPPSISADLPNSPKRRRALPRRVVKVAIRDIDVAHFNKQGEYCTTLPSDSWAWRKYGQKPIKGSPYPRGYYRCSSSKGCPARKQVEKSRSDPSFLSITYSHDHNHSFPAANSRTLKNAVTTTTTAAAASVVPAARIGPGCKAEGKFEDLAGDVESLITSEDFAWSSVSDFEMTSVIFEGSFFSRSGVEDDLAGCFPMREEDESFFADLGELPECSVVFGATAAREEERIPRAEAYSFHRGC